MGGSQAWIEQGRDQAVLLAIAGQGRCGDGVGNHPHQDTFPTLPSGIVGGQPIGLRAPIG